MASICKTGVLVLALALFATPLVRAGGDADAHDDNAGDQRHSHDLEVGEAIRTVQHVIVHDTLAEYLAVSRALSVKGSI